MSDWVRFTRDCTLDDLPPDMAGAIQKHIELYGLGLNATHAAACVETTSKKAKAGLLGRGGKNVVTGVLLLPGWLLWAIRADSPEVMVTSARLADVTVQDYAATPLARMAPDSGVEITGSFTDTPQRGSSFIGLDGGPAAQRFKQMLMQAAEAAKK